MSYSVSDILSELSNNWQKFFENVENFKKSGKVFVDIGVTKES